MKLVLGVFVISVATGCASLDPLYTVVRTTASISECQSKSATVDSIVNGQEVKLGDPDESLVTMLKIKRGWKESICTGTLISDRVVLTAAHCVVNADPESISAKFITENSCPIGQRRPYEVVGSNVVIHREFDGTPQSRADIAVIELAEPAPLDQQRVKLVDEANPPTGEEALLIGYGITNEKKADSQVLRRISKNLASDFQFRERDLLIDQSREKGGFCRGDSGAPILADVYGEKRIIAINSANVGLTADKECQTLSVAMRTSYFREWIVGQQTKFDRRGWFGRMMSFQGSTYE